MTGSSARCGTTRRSRTPSPATRGIATAASHAEGREWVGGRSVDSDHRPHDDEDNSDRCESEPGATADAERRASHHGPLEQAVRQDRGREGETEPDHEQWPTGETGPLLGEPQEDRPVVEVEPVHDRTDRDERTQREERHERTAAAENREDQRARDEREEQKTAAPHGTVGKWHIDHTPDRHCEGRHAGADQYPARAFREVEPPVPDEHCEGRAGEQLGEAGVGSVIEAIEARAAFVQHRHPHGRQQTRLHPARRRGHGASGSSG